MINDKGGFVRRWLQSIQGPGDSWYNGGWCRDADLNLQPWINVWCAGNSWMAWLAVDAIWHNYHERVAPACIVCIKASDNSVHLEDLLESIGKRVRLLPMARDADKRVRLLPMARDADDERLIARVKVLRTDMSLMSQTLNLGKDKMVKVLDMRSRETPGKRVWLSVENEHSSTAPIVKVFTGTGCDSCNTPTRNASNRARWERDAY